MTTLSWLSPSVEVRSSRIQGRGLFARVAIPAHEVVAVKGGHVFGKAMRDELQARLGPAEIQIGDGLFIGAVSEEEREGCMIFSNHSCEPNIGVRGEVTFAAMRDIEAGEELTHDWATTDDDDERLECRCGAAGCRGVVTGRDWRHPELQRRYRGWFSAYLQRKIEAPEAGG
jgi:SET domain-containing protein